jgi:hypothetical protein
MAESYRFGIRWVRGITQVSAVKAETGRKLLNSVRENEYIDRNFGAVLLMIFLDQASVWDL